MNILYILGNGFDLNLGLKTSYKDFYTYYHSIDASTNAISHLKKDLSINYNNWADLELAIGRYTENLESTEVFDEVFEDLVQQLAAYLKKEEEQFVTTTVDQKKFFENLIKPENFLLPTDRDIITSYRNKFIGSQWNINIITFNYTNIIEKILVQQSNIKIGTHHNGYSILLKGVEHIHGTLDQQMVLGVNDLSQLNNSNFHNNIDITEAIIKENCNKANRHNRDNLFKNEIRNANLICIFGSSIGDTDKRWWEEIGEKLKSGIPIIIFTKGEEISPIFAYKKNRTERKIRDYFLNKTKLTETEKKNISPNIYIGLNTSMFKDIQNS